LLYVYYEIDIVFDGRSLNSEKCNTNYRNALVTHDKIVRL